MTNELTIKVKADYISDVLGLLETLDNEGYLDDSVITITSKDKKVDVIVIKGKEGNE